MVHKAFILRYNNLFTLASHLNITPYKWNLTSFRFELKTSVTAFLVRLFIQNYVCIHSSFLLIKLGRTYKSAHIIELVTHIYWTLAYAYCAMSQITLTLKTNEILKYINHFMYVCCKIEGNTLFSYYYISKILNGIVLSSLSVRVHSL